MTTPAAICSCSSDTYGNFGELSTHDNSHGQRMTTPAFCPENRAYLIVFERVYEPVRAGPVFKAFIPCIKPRRLLGATPPPARTRRYAPPPGIPQKVSPTGSSTNERHHHRNKPAKPFLSKFAGTCGPPVRRYAPRTRPPWGRASPPPAYGGSPHPAPTALFSRKGVDTTPKKASWPGVETRYGHGRSLDDTNIV